MNLDLLAAWPEIVGEPYETSTRPQTIKWPKRLSEDDPFEPAILVIACEPTMALFLQHEEMQLLERVNRFFGFRAISRIKIEQKPIAKQRSPRVHEASLSPMARNRLEAILEQIEDPNTKERLRRLGEAVFAKNARI